MLPVKQNKLHRMLSVSYPVLSVEDAIKKSIRESLSTHNVMIREYANGTWEAWQEDVFEFTWDFFVSGIPYDDIFCARFTDTRSIDIPPVSSMGQIHAVDFPRSDFEHPIIKLTPSGWVLSSGISNNSLIERLADVAR